MNFLDNGKNRTITVVCSLIACLCIYLIQDDSLFRMMNASSNDEIGEFEKLEKDVRKKQLGNYFWEDLSNRDRLVAGDSIFTGTDSSVTVKLYGGQVITIAPNSLIKFRTKNKKLMIDIPYGGVELTSVVKDLVITDCGQDFDLSQGADSINLRKSEKCGSVTVDTKSKIVTKNFKEKKIKKDIKETFIEVAKTGVLAEIKSPAVAPPVITAPETSPPAVTAPEITTTVIEQEIPAVAKPIAPLQAPKFDNLNVRYPVSAAKPLTLKWKPVDLATSYEVEVSESADFSSVTKFPTTNPQITIDKVTSNLYFRGKTIGENNLESEPSETGQVRLQFPPIKIDTPFLTKEYKAKNSQDNGAPEKFDVSWSSVPLAKNYRVEVKDLESDKTIAKITSRTPASEIEIPQTGKYLYQVHALDDNGRKISSSDMGEVLYSKVFSAIAPVIQVGLSDRFYYFQKNSGKYVWLNWIPQGPEKRFKVEIATDKDFGTIVKSIFSTKQKVLVADQIQEGEYFWRVRTEENDQHSDWSNIETFKIKVGP